MSETENFIHDKYGYCYYDLKDKPFIFGLFVEPEHRRKGNARKYLQYVINEIRASGYKGEIEIEAKPEAEDIIRDRLVLFYESMGLKVI